MEFKVQFNKTSQRIPVRFNANKQNLPVRFENLSIITVTEDAEPYIGDYEVIPSPSPIVLPTAKKLMNEDVKVHAIPVFNVSNEAGGTTFYIATMDE